MPAGRKKKPTKLKVLHGTKRDDRDNPEAPEAETIVSAPPPDHFDSYTKKVWYDTSRVLSNWGLLEKVSLSQLQTYCYAAGKIQKLQEVIEEEGEIIEQITERGHGLKKVPHPANALINQYANIMVKIGSEFGFTPAMRSKVSVKPKKEKDELEKLMG